MSQLDPRKLHVTFASAGEMPARRYTLTHSDLTGDLFLTIGPDYDRKQISGFYIRLMRDEVLAELTRDPDGPCLHVYVHVSGGLAFGGAGWRNDILHYHMPMVLEAIRHGDRDHFAAHPELDKASVRVHFHSHLSHYNAVEEWEPLETYRI